MSLFLRSFGVWRMISAYESSKMWFRRTLIWQLPGWLRIAGCERK